MAIAILPYGQPSAHGAALAAVAASDVLWVGPAPAGVERLADLGPADHVVIMASSRAFSARTEGLRSRVSLAIREPRTIQLRYYHLVRWITARRFHRVLTHDTSLLAAVPNARFLPSGETWIHDHQSVDCTKAARVAMIASDKRTTEGQCLRHSIAAWSRSTPAGQDLVLLGRGYRPIGDKSEGHARFRHSVVIENGRLPGYFSEKLVDCLLCNSVPIYWGAPDIGHFFDIRGLIVCRSEREIRAAIESCDERDYESRLPFVLENRRRAHRFARLGPMVAEALEESP